MSRVRPILAVFAAFIICAAVGCRHGDGVIATPVVIPGPPGPASGNWVIDSLIIRTINMAHHLDGYTFSFKDSSVLYVNTNVSIVMGAWQTYMQSGKPTLAITMIH